jgi:hypothetical protein
MFRFFGRAKRARAVASSIAQLIHMLSHGHETMGPKSPERLLRGLGTRVSEEMMGKTRVIRALVPMMPDEAMFVTLLVEATKQALLIDGRDDYSGFSLSCGLPSRKIVIDLRPEPLQKLGGQARLLYAAYRMMPGVVEAP